LREELCKLVLPQHEIRNGFIATPGPNLGARYHSTVNIILALFFPSMRHQPGS
jgi:hypothetical protein